MEHPVQYAPLDNLSFEALLWRARLWPSDPANTGPQVSPCLDRSHREDLRGTRVHSAMADPRPTMAQDPGHSFSLREIVF
jgi:hypothetical protein